MSSAAARQAAYRRREAEGRCVISLEIEAADVDFLVAARLLDARSSFYSREQIAEAVRQFLHFSRCA